MKSFRPSVVLTFLFVMLLVSCTDNNNNEDTPANESNTTTTEKNNTKWTEVGSIINGSPVVTGDKSALIANYNETLYKKSGIVGDFTDVYIVEDNKEYQLVFQGAVYKSSFYVRRSTSNSLMAAGDTSCSSSDCPTDRLGCIVKYDQGEPGYCSPCNNDGKCTKTVSNVTMLSYSLRAS